jgi:transcriptional regulator with XRE-family HTH domain
MPKARKKPRQTPGDSFDAIGKSLKSIRKRRGFTQKGLGERIGVTREAITAYEAGKTHLADTTLLDIAAVLRVSVNEILGLERQAAETPEISRRWAKRMAAIESLPDSIKKHILRTLDDVIKSNTRLSIFVDEKE